MDLTKSQASLTVSTTMTWPPLVSTAKKQDRHFIPLSEEPGMTALDQSKSRLRTSVKLNTDHSGDELNDDTNESQYSEPDETENNANTIFLKTKVKRMLCSE